MCLRTHPAGVAQHAILRLVEDAAVLVAICSGYRI
jgi:hypothetical protein